MADLDDELAELLGTGDRTVAVAESLTGGMLANRLARLPAAGTWFRGGVVAYSRLAKERLLSIGEAPVVSEAAARSMAEAVAEQLDADLTLSVTGVGGPDPQEEIEPGTVWMAVRTPDGVDAELHHFDGDPAEVCERTCDLALRMLREVLRRPAP